jgi:hypothetical protein
MVCATTATGSGMCQARSPMDHFEMLLEETCPNHAYPIKQKVRNYGMMKNFMASGSLVRGMEVDEVPDEGDMTPFLGEDAVMMIYDGRPTVGMCRVPNPSLGTPTCYGWGCRNVGM